MPEIIDAIGLWVPRQALVRGLGCDVQWRERRAANAGAPTIRKRLFMIGRTDGRPIVWTSPKRHQAPQPGQLPWRSAAKCIDWSDLGTSLFDRARPLVDNTCRRVAKGFWRHTVMADQPYLVPMDAQHLAAASLTEFANASNQRTFSVAEPLRTQVAQVKGGHFALSAATLVEIGYGERAGQAPRAPGLAKPLGTVVASGRKHALVTAAMVTLRKGSVGNGLLQPMNAITTGSGHHAIAACHFEQANGGFYKREVFLGSCQEDVFRFALIDLLEASPLYAHPPAQAQHSVPGKYDDVLLPFLKSMEHELRANAGKGDRPGWLQMDRRTALLEIYYHLAKLQKATKDNDAAGIVEYAADVANMSMMLVDVCGLLAAAPGKEGV